MNDRMTADAAKRAVRDSEDRAYLVSLLGGGRMDPVEAKMSKSSPNSAIFLHDSPEDITRKMKNAFCPAEAEGNPVLEVLNLVVFPKLGSLHIERPTKYGGPVDFANYEEVRSAYTSGNLHAQDLKKGAADGMTKMLEPVREYFKKHSENLEKVKKLSVTR